jgi:hypothetical protein
MRTCDNRFYWLSTDSIDAQHLNTMKGWNDRTRPAGLHARITPRNEPLGGGKVRVWTQVLLRTYGVRQVSIWLGPNMADFTNPVVVHHNGSPITRDIKIQPSYQIMLEDFFQNWDRQRLFFARVDVKV